MQIVTIRDYYKIILPKKTTAALKKNTSIKIAFFFLHNSRGCSY